MDQLKVLPDRGDVAFLDFQPQLGREQGGRRPALILSPRSYNEKTNLVLACPITNQVIGYPFEVPLPAGIKATGVVLSDHIKSLDWRARNAEFYCKVPEAIVLEALERLALLLSA